MRFVTVLLFVLVSICSVQSFAQDQGVSANTNEELTAILQDFELPVDERWLAAIRLSIQQRPLPQDVLFFIIPIFSCENLEPVKRESLFDSLILLGAISSDDLDSFLEKIPYVSQNLSDIDDLVQQMRVSRLLKKDSLELALSAYDLMRAHLLKAEDESVLGADERREAHYLILEADTKSCLQIKENFPRKTSLEMAYLRNIFREITLSLVKRLSHPIGDENRHASLYAKIQVIEEFRESLKK